MFGSHFAASVVANCGARVPTIDLIANRPYLPMSFVHLALPDRCLSPNVLNASRVRSRCKKLIRTKYKTRKYLQ